MSADAQPVGMAAGLGLSSSAAEVDAPRNTTTATTGDTARVDSIKQNDAMDMDQSEPDDDATRARASSDGSSADQDAEGDDDEEEDEDEDDDDEKDEDDDEDDPIVAPGYRAKQHLKSKTQQQQQQRRRTKLDLPEDLDADLYGLRRSVSRSKINETLRWLLICCFSTRDVHPPPRPR
jgi:hypothetical protein